MHSTKQKLKNFVSTRFWTFNIDFKFKIIKFQFISKAEIKNQ